jgi:hypothetical protein
MANKIYSRKTVVSESLDGRNYSLRERVRMNRLLIDRLEKRSRKLNNAIQMKLARLKFASLFRRADDQTKQEMLQIILLDGRDPRKGIAEVKVFLAKIGRQRDPNSN